MMRMQLFDYELEEWLRTTYSAACSSLPSKKLTWCHRVQYAVGHAINEYYGMIPDARARIPVHLLLERRWPKRVEDFLGEAHYRHVYRTVMEQLERIFKEANSADYPVALYEQWSTNVAELNLNLVMIFQVVWHNKQTDEFIVQKFLVQDDAEVNQAFVHMTNVFWHSVYGRPADQIVVYALMNGRKYSYLGENLPLQQSLDYMNLLAEVVMEAAPVEIPV
ncbi:hypothetical protein [Paenibacillus lentus]|uniref:Uncharacterized protein n=1 Tax=Paenibacillus lentus TaxID=1338368 RepID=A0A3Q8S6R8_9BACL|nr:hypothetical protein [Paenibacillus lentus]AZK48757.1 hypothetical protein EIM92_23350 [Paenibacillus lentus]